MKNNFHNGSYILEFFKEEGNLPEITSAELMKAAERLLEVLPIDLVVVSDRIGNIIFQFPSMILKENGKRDEMEEQMNFHMWIDPRFSDMDWLVMNIDYEYDGIIIGSAYKRLSSQKEFTIRIGDTAHVGVYTIRNTKNDLILLKHTSVLMRNIHFVLKMQSEVGRDRSIWNGARQELIDVVSYEVNETGREERIWEKRIDERCYRENMKKLVYNKEFLQYCVDLPNERQRALNDIRNLMNRGDKAPVYLWNPYLSAEDLLETWYYTKCYGKLLKAITSKACSDRCQQTVMEWGREQRRILEQESNNYGINIELRCQWNGHGFEFHDRFLMIDGEKIEVWELGTSINGLGKSHHIIQKVSNPKYIIDAFLNLWEKLEYEECLIWKRN